MPKGTRVQISDLPKIADYDLSEAAIEQRLTKSGYRISYVINAFCVKHSKYFSQQVDGYKKQKKACSGCQSEMRRTPLLDLPRQYGYILKDSKIERKKRGNQTRSYLLKIFCPHHDRSFDQALHDYKIGKKGCPQCVIEALSQPRAPTIPKLNDEAAAAGLTMIGPGRTHYYRTYRFNDCGHEKEIKTKNVRDKSVRCTDCVDPDILLLAEEKNLQYCGKTDDPNNRKFRFLACGHLQEIRLVHVRNDNFTCRTCFERDIKREAQEAGLTLIEKGSRTRYWKYRFDDCGHHREYKLEQVRRQSVLCQRCFSNKLLAEADNVGLTLIDRHYAGDMGKRVYQCNTCGHKQSITIEAVRVNSFKCHGCEDSSYDQPSFVYLLRIKVDSNQWLKLGFSKNINIRVGQYGLPDNAKVRLLVCREVATGHLASKTEKAIHRKFQDHRLPGREMNEFHTVSGFDECYPMTVLDKLTNEIEKSLS